MSDNQPPVRTFRVRGLKLTIWAKEHDGKTFYTIDLKRSFKNAQDEWQESTSINGDQAGATAALYQSAFTWIQEQESE